MLKSKAFATRYIEKALKIFCNLWNINCNEIKAFTYTLHNCGNILQNQNSVGVEKMKKTLANNDVILFGRYAEWNNKLIGDTIEEGYSLAEKLYGSG